MKISLALGPRHGLSRQTAWGCLTTNLTMPGFGSLAAGRVSGYPQALLGILAFILTTVFGVRFIRWSVVNWSRISGADGDPFSTWIDMWLAMRWAVLGILLFAVAWVWALGTSLSILRSAKQAEQNKPPPLQG